MLKQTVKCFDSVTEPQRCKCCLTLTSKEEVVFLVEEYKMMGNMEECLVTLTLSTLGLWNSLSDNPAGVVNRS